MESSLHPETPRRGEKMCIRDSGYSMLSEDEFYQIHNFCNHKIMQEFVRDNYPYLDEDACEAALTPQAVEELSLIHI